MILIAITSILTIAGLVWVFNSTLPFKVCPVCAGVAGTWLWMLAARLYGYGIEPALITMLVGGSVVGIAYQIEKMLPIGTRTLLFKTLFIPAGFVAAYGLVWFYGNLFGAGVVVAAGVALIFLKWPRPSARAGPAPGHRKEAGELEEKMKNCC